ncbi:MAG: HAD family hydrolase, partial [Firmicutes bacterium]|nr:HAD family hydrolase [Bacillota bacterium]
LKTTGMDEEDAGRLVMDMAEQSDGAMDWEGLAAPIPGTHEMLGRLQDRGFKLAVVTADSSVRARISLTALQLIDYFAVVVGADCVQNSKPAPDMALLACRELGIESGLAVVVGDTPRDIVMAREAGSAGIGVLSGVCTREQLTGATADVVINSVAELE